jgi:hypothetical protein
MINNKGSFNTNQVPSVPTPSTGAIPPSPKSLETEMKSVEDTTKPEMAESRTITVSPSKSNSIVVSDEAARSLQISASTSSTEIETSNCQGTSMDFESLWDFGGDMGDEMLPILCEDVTTYNSSYGDVGFNECSVAETGTELTQSHKELSPISQTEVSEARSRCDSYQRHTRGREQQPSIGTQPTTRQGERYRESNSFESVSFDFPNTPYTHSRLSPRNSYTPSHMPSPTSPVLPSVSSFHATSKCLIIIGKLQKLLLRHSSLSLDIILSTNKNALSELMNLLYTSPELTEDYFSQFGSDFSQNSHSVPLMIYVITLKHIYDLYIQACRIFKSSHPNHKRSPSALSPLSNPSSRPGSQSSLPQLDFGTFKIDAASQRRLFSEIILRELDNFLLVYMKVKGLFENELDDISTQMGVVEDMFLGVKDGIWRLCESIRT